MKPEIREAAQRLFRLKTETVQQVYDCPERFFAYDELISADHETLSEQFVADHAHELNGGDSWPFVA